ncbi:amino acid ABC transporter, permease protein [Candidatus Paraburkholderia calva]|nr:amino acid ABC transporter, permease protein [Candidatus Paraburkholderia calva]
MQLIAAGNIVVAAILAKNPPRRPETKFIIEDSPCFVGVNKNEPRLIAKVNDAIAQAKKDGTLNTMSKKWFGQRLPRRCNARTASAMAYQLEFGNLTQYAGMFASGTATTLALAAVSTALGVTVGVLGAVGRSSKHAWVRGTVGGYVEAIHNTPFIVQLFFVFFGLPALGIHLSDYVAAILVMTLNLGAYSIEIIRAGISAVPRGHHEAAASLAMSPGEAFRHVVLPQALAKVFPALTSQIVITILGSTVVSQISVPDLTYATSYIQSRNFRAFETCFFITSAYLVITLLLRMALNAAGRRLFAHNRSIAR